MRMAVKTAARSHCVQFLRRVLFPVRETSATPVVQSLTSQVSSLTSQMSNLTSRVSQLSTRMDSEFSAIRKDWDAKLETRFREQAEMLAERFALVNRDLLVLRKDIGAILEKLDARQPV